MTKGKTLNLKRVVNIKAIVTDEFKKYLQFEIDENIKSTYQRFKQVEKEGKAYIDSLKEQKAPQQEIEAVHAQIRAEYQQYTVTTQTLKERLEAASKLENGSFFSQGTVDGYTSVKVGDNLYQKLSGMEIVVKDGIVQDINVIGNTPQS